jgi:hypothetical protein
MVLFILSCWWGFRVAPAWGNTLLPTISEMPGWQMTDNPYSYGPQNLYKYINGEAESFIAYGFVSMKGAVYSPESDKNSFITVDIYNMGTKLNAFGMFQAKRGPETSSSKIGAASFGKDGYFVFYKQNYYVEILSFVSNDQWAKKHIVIARKVAERIQGDSSPPHELSYFSESGRIAGSQKYVRGGILGHAFLDRGLICNYRIDGEITSAFVAFFPSREVASRSFEAYKDFLQGSGQEWVALDKFGERAFASKEPYHKSILVAQDGPFVVGVYDLSTAEEGMGLLKDILKRVKTL